MCILQFPVELSGHSMASIQAETHSYSTTAFSFIFMFKFHVMFLYVVCFKLSLFLWLRLRENEQRAKVLQQEREYYSSQARTLQQSLSQLTADKQQTEAELQVTQHDSAALSSQSTQKLDHFQSRCPISWQLYVTVFIKTALIAEALFQSHYS